MRYSEAFKKMGCPLSNFRTDWSAESNSGVCISLWEKEIKRRGQKASFDTRKDASSIQYWGHKRGNLKRARHLQTAKTKFAGRVRVVLVTGVPGKGYGDALPQLNQSWRITYFDPRTGHFAVSS